jgi:hypothetical protein
MQNLLLLVQDKNDIAALPVAKKEIKRIGYSGMWVVYSPAVLVDDEKAAKEHDVAIADITDAIKQCASRMDFDGAKNYKVKLDAAILEKTEKVKTAYTRLTEEHKKLAFADVFGAFFKDPACASVKVDEATQHYEKDNFIEFLNSLKGNWFKPFVTGSFSFDWPTSFLPNGSAVAESPSVAVSKTPSPSNQPVRILANQTPEFKVIVRMGLDGMGQEAIRIGINPSGMGLLKLAHAIYNKKHKVAA